LIPDIVTSHSRQGLKLTNEVKDVGDDEADCRLPRPDAREGVRVVAGVRPDGEQRQWRDAGDAGQGDCGAGVDEGPEGGGARFDRFGLFNSNIGGQLVRIYLDDLKYMAGRPEP
jgi:hypothetical protein